MSGQKLTSVQDVDNHKKHSDELGEFFRIHISELASGSADGYRKALASYRALQSADGQTGLTLTPASLRDWLAHIAWRRLTPKTILTYFTRLSALATAAMRRGLLTQVQTDEFRRLKPILLSYDPERTRNTVDAGSHSRLINLTRTLHRADGDTRLYGSLLLISLLNGAIPPVRVARLKTADLPGLTPESRQLVDPFLTPTRTYVFPFDQSHSTPRQLERKINGGLRRVLETHGIPCAADPGETIRGHWAYAALECGIAPSLIHRLTGAYGDPLPELTLGASAMQFYGTPEIEPLDFPSRQAIISQVAGSFTRNPLNWYAMRLRPHVKYERLTTRIEQAQPDASQRPELFYPCSEIARRVGRHIVSQQSPVLPGIVFFRTRVTDILPLFREIGDLAWCYTLGGTYARIPAHAMATFQQAIGRFTPDYEVGPAGSLPLRSGDHVEVVGGPFAGYQGEITAASGQVTQTGDTPTADLAAAPGVVYRIRLFGDNHDIEWRLRDPRLVRKLED